MAVGLGSTFEEVIKKINSCGDVTAAGNNTFTGINIFHKEETATSGDKTISEAKIDPGPTAPLILLEKKTVASDGFTVTGDATIRPDSIVLSNTGGGCTTSITHDGFTADSSGIYTKYYIGSIVHNTASSVTEQTLTFPDKSGTFALTDDIDVTAAGDNTFSGSNVFKKAVTLYTDAANGNSMSATLDSYKLKLFNDLGGVYADLNITSDTAPYLELKTVGYGKVKYTSESIIFTDTQGNGKTTTLKFPGQGATADSTKTLATNEDLDKKQPLLVSGTNVKTINGQSILGSGNLEISGGGGYPLFLHTLQFSGPNVFYGFTTIISKRAEPITTKTDIEAILGSSFFYPCSWYLEDTNTFGFYMTDSVFQSINETTTIDWTSIDIYDQVTQLQ